MRVSDEMRERFGKCCRWLDWDCDCHRTKCRLYWARRETLYEKFEKMGFLHPEFAYNVFNDCCYLNNDGFKCFDGSERVENGMDEDDEMMTKEERAAMKAVESEFDTEEKVRKFYALGKENYLKDAEDFIQKKLRALDEVRNEVDNGKTEAK